MNVLSSLLNFIGGKISDFNTRLTTLTNNYTSLNAYTVLDITRVISTTYMTDTQFNRLAARRRGNMLFLYFNAEFTSTGFNASSDFQTIATISGWPTGYNTYATIPNQNDSTKVMVLEVRLDGAVRVYSTKPISGWYRTHVCVPINT